MSDEPSRKRQKPPYGPDGMKLLSARTRRRHRLQAAQHRQQAAEERTAEFMRDAVEDPDVRTVLMHAVRLRAWPVQDFAPEPTGSHIKPVEPDENHEVPSCRLADREGGSAQDSPGSYTDQILRDKGRRSNSSDFGVSTPGTSAHQPREDCKRDARLFSQTVADNIVGDDAGVVSADESSDLESDRLGAVDGPLWSDSSSRSDADGASSTVLPDFDRDDATAARCGAYADEYSDLESDRSSAVDDSSCRNSSSPVLSDFNRDDATAARLREYVHNGEGDELMFRESNMRTWQVVLVVLGLCTRFSFTKAARRAIIDAVRLFAGPRFSHWNISDYYLSKIFDPPDDVTLYHFYCEVCHRELEKPVPKGKFKKHEATCKTCSTTCQLTLDAQNSFISIDLQYQLMSLINSKVVNDDLSKNLKNLQTNVRSDGDIRDVYDGYLYKKLLSQTPPQSRLLTCVFNTDGAPIFNSSKRAFWPILITINELSPRVRFKYPLLAGVCVVRKEPTPDLMNTYMLPFVRSLLKLGTTGFHAQVSGKTIHFVLKPLLCTVDSVARPLLQNRLQFNGYYGCSWCYAKGEHRNGCMRFLMENCDPMNRTHRHYIADVRAAEIKNRGTKGRQKKGTVRGVRGNSVLTLFTTFDMIWGFVRDYLHADLIGGVLQLFNMFTDPHCPVRLTKAQLNEINERLIRMTPPGEVHRLVRPLKTEKCKWKASEWRSWSLFYAIPCLTGILDTYALRHFALYVRSIYTLLQTNITETELQRVHYDLQRFVIIFEVLYGPKYVTFNIHSLKHVVDCVRYCGPLWATSTFPFESTIRDLKQHVHGTRNVADEMVKKSVQRNVYRTLLDEADECQNCLSFQQSLFGRTENASCYRSGTGVVFLGAVHKYQGAAPELTLLHADEIRAYRRCVWAGTIIHSAAYDKITLKSDNTVFRTDEGKYVQVLYLLQVRDLALAHVASLGVEQVVVLNEQEHCQDLPEIEDVTIHHLVRVVKDDGEKVINITSLREKCVVMKVDDQTYFSRLPNTLEIQ